MFGRIHQWSHLVLGAFLFLFLIFKIINSVSLLVNRYLQIFRFFLSQSLGLCHLGICLFHLSYNSLAYSCFVVSLNPLRYYFLSLVFYIYTMYNTTKCELLLNLTWVCLQSEDEPIFSSGKFTYILSLKIAFPSSFFPFSFYGTLWTSMSLDVHIFYHNSLHSIQDFFSFFPPFH